jgi:hypothetical protein
VDSSHCTQSGGRMICEYKTGKDVEVSGHAVTCSTVLAIALNNRTNRTYDSPSPDCDLITGPPEYEAEVTLSRMQIRQS